MFLQPQHFQQQDYALEHRIAASIQSVQYYRWGFLQLAFDHQLLQQGKFSLTRASGCFQDGTLFSFPDYDNVPAVLNIAPNQHDIMIYLALPIRRHGEKEIGQHDQERDQARYYRTESELYDNTVNEPNKLSIETAALKLRLVTNQDDLSGYHTLAIAKVIESRDDGTLLLDKNWIPPFINFNHQPLLHGYLQELIGLLQQKGEALSALLQGNRQGGSGQISDYLLLQVVNRMQPYLIDLAQRKQLHPVDVYGVLLQLIGELSTFTVHSKRPAEFPRYLHDELFNTFHPVISAIRSSLTHVSEQIALELPLQQRKFGIYVSEIGERQLLSSASFVLAIKADIATEELRTLIPKKVKVAPVERIRQLVNLQLPGLTLLPLATVPRQIPFHVGFIYFQLETQHELWKDLQQSAGFALHIDDSFPGIELEFWAIRS